MKRENKASLAGVMAKRFEKINKKREKKGMQALTLAEFAEKNRRAEVVWHICSIISDILFEISILFSAIGMVIRYDVLTGVLYGIILSIIIGLWCYFCWRTMGADYKMRLHILSECEEQGIGIREYWDKIQEGDMQ